MSDRNILRSIVAHAAPIVPDQDVARPSHLAASLRAEFEQLASATSAASRRMDEADERLQQPEIPDALFLRDNDDSGAMRCSPTKHTGSGKLWWGDQVQVLRRLKFIRNDRVGQTEARRDEIVAAYDQWQADELAADRSCSSSGASQDRRSRRPRSS